MKYLLDTNTCIRFINGRSPGIRAKMLTMDDSEIAISAIVQAEMYAGSAKSRTPQRSREIQEEFFQRFVLIPFDTQAARIYGDIRLRLSFRMRSTMKNRMTPKARRAGRAWIVRQLSN